MKPVKNNVLTVFVAFFILALTACGNGGSNGDTVKVDTVVNPADNTNTKQSNSTLPKGAVGMDTVAGGKSSSSGIKDTTKHK